jgi:hypothetical protein
VMGPRDPHRGVVGELIGAGLAGERRQDRADDLSLLVADDPPWRLSSRNDRKRYEKRYERHPELTHAWILALDAESVNRYFDNDGLDDYTPAL